MFESVLSALMNLSAVIRTIWRTFTVSFLEGDFKDRPPLMLSVAWECFDDEMQG